ncbi:maternal protein tudor-like isoform X1 [Dendroctonus ponderosae]|uniref:maternal protein tudor-like isoform X1 n=1 Tax=Dendroctonus ponderosae TaxID=77166 RepID=UPI002034BE13|nr:maternal protein tudor-like isoform X1 [Dendroctonus ponderosae]
MMEEIQQFYKGRKAELSAVGAPVIGLFPEDSVLYRGQVLEVLGNQYKVLYVDFGNVSTVNKVWPIDKKFMQMPAQAICCGFKGIEPIGGNWPDPSTFAQYFGKDCFMARFLEKNDDRTFIQLWDNQEEMSQLLIQSNLAISAKPHIETDESVDIYLLLSQQFRVVLKSVNNLNDIIVALECGLALTCKAHNLELATESHEDALKAYLEQTLIIYVDNVLENEQLEVTFYDNEGNKIDILSPDEGAYQNVEPLCQTLINSSQLKGLVSHANETSVFIQPAMYAEQILVFLDQIFEAYDTRNEESTIIPEEGFVYAVHGSDGNWYRGRVETFDDDKATITYVDYGNSESVPFSDLRELSPEFNVPNVMCVKVNLTSGTASSFLDKEVVASIYYGYSGWEGTIQECINNENISETAIEVTNTDTALPLTDGPQQKSGDSELIVDDAEVHNTDYVNNEAEQNLVTEYINTVVSTPLNGTSIHVSHIDTPTEFYVQFGESKSAIDELQELLQAQVDEMPALENASVGILCAAPYSVDGLWYRAEVLDADEDITTVRFVDFGNTDVIDNKTTQVKTLPPNLLTLAVYATRCSLKLKSLDEEWSQQALELFESLALQPNLQAEYLTQDEKTTILELYSNGVNVKDELLAHNYAVPCEIITENKTTCFVSHLNSPSEFWVQMESCINELEWIAEQLSGAELFSELDDMSPGALCAALFPDDEMWYRARILSNTIAGIELLFIDYGNSCVSNSLRQLPEDIVVTPPLAQKCCLQKPDGIPYWTKEAQDKFAELSAEGQTIFELKKISSGETTTVELLLNSENIVPKILPVTQDGCLKNFQSLNKFDLEKTGDILGENVCLEPLPGMEWDEESNKKFSEIYSEGSLFQVELLGEDCVRLYQNGADIRIGLGGSKINVNQSSELPLINDSIIVYNTGSGNLETTSPIDCSNQDDPSITVESIESAEISSIQSCSPHLSVYDSSNLEISTSNLTNDKAELAPEINTSLQGIEKLNNTNEQVLENIEGCVAAKMPDSSQKITDLLTEVGSISQNIDVSANCSTNLSFDSAKTSEGMSSESGIVCDVQLSSDFSSDSVAKQSSVLEKSDDPASENNSVPQINETVDDMSKTDEIAQLHEAGQKNEKAKTNLVKNLPEVAVTSPSTSQEQSTCSVKESTTEEKTTKSRPTSRDRFPISHDDKIIPACASRPQSPLSSDEEPGAELPTSRPASSQGFRVSHDEKILPAVLSRPQTPLLDCDSAEN